MSLMTLSPPMEAAADAPPRTPSLAFLKRSLPRWEFAAALCLTGLAGFLHLFLYTRHYPLWRDEVTTAQLATCPRFADTFRLLPFDSCPLLFLGLARTWAALAPDAVDWHFRLLGLCIGLGGLGMLWLCARTLGGRVPLLSLALLGLNPVYVRYGDSVRPYGVGILLAMLVILTVWRVVEDARPGRILLAAAVGVLAVNALFYNAVLLLAACGAGGVVVLARDGNWRKALLLPSLGLPAALSLLVYREMIREQHRWAFLLSQPVDAAWLWKKLSEATGSPDPVGIWVWPVLFLGLAGWAGWAVWRLRGWTRPAGPWPRGDQALAFTAFTLVAGTVGYALFLKVLRYHTQPWYYITLLAFAAVCFDALYGRLAETATHAAVWRAARLLFVFAFATVTFLQARQELLTRPTNLDLVAARVAAEADADDLIVHERWECAITFAHYYQGRTPQVTLPPLADHRVHRYDQVFAQMQTADAVQPVLDRITQTLRGGHRIWLVGYPMLPPEGKTAPAPPALSRQPDGTWGPRVDYYGDWAMQASVVLAQQATGARILAVPVSQPVAFYENLPLCLVQGWRTPN